MKPSHVEVVGGAYGEECSFPPRKIYRGSGGRAAAVLSSLGVKTTLNTVTGPLLGSVFQSIAETCGYELKAAPGTEDIWFRYRHPLSHPTIYPPQPKAISSRAPIHVETALIFGMLEGRPEVHAKKAVYDPQDGSRSQHFFANGSSASELAVVASYSEAKALTGESAPEAMAANLLSDPRISAVVIKCGPQGALVKTRSDQDWIRAFPTKRVYKVGSGDVFSAAFTFAWISQGKDPISSAWFASRIVAAYVETGQDRIDNSLSALFESETLKARELYSGKGPRALPKTQIYLAGPFFNTAQQWLIDEARGALMDMGFTVFSPVHEVGFGPAEEVAQADLKGLDASGLVLAVLDGLDAGTVFEVGYARAKNIPVVAIAECVDTNDLTMMIGSGCVMTNDFATAIYLACWHLMGDV
ncbi:MAG: PfkB family carbohydrate kinase [Moraxellaceae bacterium]